jgi:hypothetical protein
MSGPDPAGVAGHALDRDGGIRSDHSGTVALTLAAVMAERRGRTGPGQQRDEDEGQGRERGCEATAGGGASGFRHGGIPVRRTRLVIIDGRGSGSSGRPLFRRADKKNSDSL